MNKTLLLAELVIVLLVIVPQVFSFDCSKLDAKYQDACKSIESSGVENKDLLIVNLAYNSNYKPDHDFLYDWNTIIEFNSVPEGVDGINKRFIKDAWMKIFAVTPSVLYNNSLYVPETSQVLVGYNYRVALPRNYIAEEYPDKSNGDCKRTYALTKESAYNNIYVGTNLQDTGKLGIIRVSEDSEINSKFNVNVRVAVDHYKWYTYCVRRKEGRCVSYAHKCKYSKTERITDYVELKDSQSVKFYNSIADASLVTVNSYSRNVKAEINFSDSAVFDFGNSKYSLIKYFYDVVPSFSPYHILTLRARDSNEEEIINLHKSEDHVIVNSPETCTINFWDHFSESQKICSIDFEDVNLQVRTDKLTYKEGEKIIVSITPEDLDVTLTYGDSTLNVRGSAEFTAEKSYNRIKAVYGDVISEKVIFVSRKSVLPILWNVSIFTGVMVFVFIVVKRSWKW